MGVEIATFVTIPLILGAVAPFAVYVPTRRASSVDPGGALRSESLADERQPAGGPSGCKGHSGGCARVQLSPAIFQPSSVWSRVAASIPQWLNVEPA